MRTVIYTYKIWGKMVKEVVQDFLCLIFIKNLGLNTVYAPFPYLLFKRMIQILVRRIQFYSYHPQRIVMTM